MAGWKLEKKIEDPRGNRSVELRRSPTGELFRYQVVEWVDACDEDEGALGDGFWTCTDISGYFDTLSECEAEARKSVNWLT